MNASANECPWFLTLIDWIYFSSDFISSYLFLIASSVPSALPLWICMFCSASPPRLLMFVNSISSCSSSCPGSPLKQQGLTKSMIGMKITATIRRPRPTCIYVASSFPIYATSLGAFDVPPLKTVSIMRLITDGINLFLASPVGGSRKLSSGISESV